MVVPAPELIGDAIRPAVVLTCGHAATSLLHVASKVGVHGEGMLPVVLAELKLGKYRVETCSLKREQMFGAMPRTLAIKAYMSLGDLFYVHPVE